MKRWHELVNDAPPDLNKHGFIHYFIGDLVDVFRRRRALIRAVLVRGMMRPETCERNREQAPIITNAFTAAIAAKRGVRPSKVLSRRISIGFQLVFGTLHNLLLNDPGPLRLGDSEIEVELTLAVEPAISTGDSPSGRQ